MKWSLDINPYKSPNQQPRRSARYQAFFSSKATCPRPTPNSSVSQSLPVTVAGLQDWSAYLWAVLFPHWWRLLPANLSPSGREYFLGTCWHIPDPGHRSSRYWYPLPALRDRRDKEDPSSPSGYWYGPVLMDRGRLHFQATRFCIPDGHIKRAWRLSGAKMSGRQGRRSRTVWAIIVAWVGKYSIFSGTRRTLMTLATSVRGVGAALFIHIGAHLVNVGVDAAEIATFIAMMVWASSRSTCHRAVLTL